MRHGEITLREVTPLRHAVNTMRRLKTLHERPVLKAFNPPREERPMSRRGYRSLVAILLERMGGKPAHLRRNV